MEPEARVEEFSPLCEVQSDKASVEITSRFAGIVKKLHYEAGEMAQVGKPFVDIDIQGGVNQEDLDTLTAPEPTSGGAAEPLNRESLSRPASTPSPESTETSGGPGAQTQTQTPPKPKSRFASLATPAVRHLSKELKVDITEIDGTGKDGRVLKEDIYRFVKARDAPRPPVPAPASAPPSAAGAPTPSPAAFVEPPPPTDKQVETVVPLTNTQAQMFKTMTRSLAIPHFLYADEVDFTRLEELRQRLNATLARQPAAVAVGSADGNQQPQEPIVVSKLSYLPFLIKAVSMALHRYPILNARVEASDESGAAESNGSATTKSSAATPRLVYRSQHNVGVAMDTPAGLLVPVIRGVEGRSVLSVAAELQRLQRAASAGRLAPADLRGGTVTVSNIGSVGGTYVAPVIVDREVAILGVGRTRVVPAFGGADGTQVVRKTVGNLSWSADHRVVDGATAARAAEVVRGFVEEPGLMAVHMR